MMLRVEHGTINGSRLITTDAHAAGQVIATITAPRRIAHPTYRSIQIGPDAHVEELGVLGYLNHSCRPTCVIDTTTLRVVAARDVEAGEELTFFYPSTEWDMDRPFRCRCGAPECIGLVAGAKHLAPRSLRRYTRAPPIRHLVADAGEQE
jgi:hypothetical protein